MRIGIEGRTLQERRYGVARYVNGVLPWMVSLAPDNEYLLYVTPGGGPVDVCEGVQSREVASMGPSLAWRHMALPGAMKRDGVDLHYSPSYFVPLRKVCPAVAVVHDVSFLAHPEWFHADWRMRFDRIFWDAVRKTEAIITISDYSKREIERLLGVEPVIVRVIPGGFSEQFSPAAAHDDDEEIRSRYGLEAGFVLSVGSLHTRRNVPKLIEAISRLDRQLLVVGAQAPFSETVDVEALAAAHGVAARVTHVEYVSEGDLIALYRACGALAYPSLYEGFGLPVLEAMACGAPVACSNATSIPEVAGDAAIYFDPTDSEGMARAIEAACEGGASLRAGSLERASRFSWERTARETLEAMDQVMEVTS